MKNHEKFNQSKNKYVKRKKVKVKKQSRVAMLDDDNDIPVVRNSESISSYENRTGRGFWGNPSSGYVYDKDNR